MDDFEEAAQRERLSYERYEREQIDAEAKASRDRGVAYQSDGIGSKAGTWEGFIALLIIPAVLVWAVNSLCPFWMRCIFALAAGPLAVKYITKRWRLHPLAKLAIGVAVSALLLAIFHDGNGFGMAIFNLYAKVIVGGFCLLLVAGVVVIARDRFRDAFTLIGKHPLQIGCVGLIALWAAWTLFMAAIHPIAVSSHPGLSAGASASGGHQ